VPWLAAIVLALGVGGVVSRSAAVDGGAVDAALAIRAADEATTWSIAIDDASRTEVRVLLRHDSGREVHRTYALAGTTVEERSRELAAALALVLEQQRDASTRTGAKRSPADRRSESVPPAQAVAPSGWIAAGARLAAGRPADVDGGATVRGGLWWGRRILQPMAQLASVHARRGGLRVDGVRVGVGLGAGAPWRQWWFGGAVLGQLTWTRARDRGADGRVGSSTEITGVAQWRARSGLFVAGRVGLDVTAPPLRARGDAERLRFGPVRAVLGVEVGLQLPWRPDR
jgi:hypothetical protein